MKIQIPTKKYTIVEELSKPFPVTKWVTTRKVDDHLVVSYVSQVVGSVHCWGLDRTQETVWYCESCGCEPYAVWPDPSYYLGYSGNTNEWYSYTMRNLDSLKPYYERERKIEEFEKAREIEKRGITTCPVCGNKLSFGKNDNAEIYENYQKLEAYVKSCDLPSHRDVKADEVANIKTDLEKLKNYFLSIIKVESNIISIRQRLFLLYSLSGEVNRQAKFAQLYPIISQKKELTEQFDALQVEFKRKANELAEVKRERDVLCSEEIVVPHIPLPLQPIEPAKPIYANANIFNRKKIAAENEAKTEKYNSEVALYNKALAEYPALLENAKKNQEEARERAIRDREREVLKFNEDINAKTIDIEEFKKAMEAQQIDLENQLSRLQNNTDYPEVQLKISIDKEIEEAESLLLNSFKQRNQLYATEIIFGKYRDIAAVTSFYEYLLSGRCDTLDGINGCYNLYESELRTNKIVNKLDAISNSLEIIKDNQYMLYSQLSQINATLDSLNATTTAMFNGIRDTAEVFLKNNAIIAHNSAVSAYYAKVNAEIASADRYISMICW